MNTRNKSVATIILATFIICLPFGLLKQLEIKSARAAELEQQYKVTDSQLKEVQLAMQEATATPRLSDAFKTQKQQILAYIVSKFGDSAADAITIIRKCENSTFDPTRMNKSNKNGTWDVGVMQINVDPENAAEVKKLQDYRYNIDRGYQKFLQGDGGKHRKTFYLWTCGHEIGQYTYVDRLKGK